MFRRREPELEVLRALEPFSACSDRQLEEVRRNLTPVRVGEGEQLVRSGQLAKEVFLLLDGEVVVTTRERGEEREAVVGAGALLGEAAVVDGGRSRAEVRTRTDVRAYVCTPQEFSAVLAAAPALAAQVREESRTRQEEQDTELLLEAESEWMRTRVGRGRTVERGLRELQEYLRGR